VTDEEQYASNGRTASKKPKTLPVERTRTKQRALYLTSVESVISDLLHEQEENGHCSLKSHQLGRMHCYLELLVCLILCSSLFTWNVMCDPPPLHARSVFFWVRSGVFFASSCLKRRILMMIRHGVREQSSNSDSRVDTTDLRGHSAVGRNLLLATRGYQLTRNSGSQLPRNNTDILSCSPSLRSRE
jgi:hypothetical protein